MAQNISSSSGDSPSYPSKHLLVNLLNYQVLDAISASIYLKDINGVYLDCNRYMIEIAGLERREAIIGKTDHDLPWRNQAGKIREIDQLVINNNKTFKLEEKPKIYSGQVKTFLSSKTPLLDDQGKVIGVIGVSIDITDKKEIEYVLELTEEHLQKSLSIKERFLRNIDHETRNPLQAFVVSAEVLAESWKKFSDKQKYESIVLIADSARRLANLVTDTFDLSNLIKNETKLKFEKGNITELVRDCAKLFNESSSINKKSFITVDTSVKYTLIYDRELIEKVINKLFANAIKWSSSNEAVTVELRKDFMPQSTISGIYCTVTNKGIKIPADELNFIFEPFTESSNTASKAQGIGLGLALCKEIIRAHRGEIWANNNNDGVSFSFFIPSTLAETTLTEKQTQLEANPHTEQISELKTNTLKLTPVNRRSSYIVQKGEYALIGVSPFNSYFSTENIANILQVVVEQFKDFAIFIPDKISRYTLEASNYQGNIHQKIRKQDNYLKNRVKNALLELGISNEQRIILLSNIVDDKSYRWSYDVVIDRFNNDEHFRNGCLATSRKIISNYRIENEAYQGKSIIDTESLNVGVQYFLKELPLFLHAPEILNVSSCCFIYPVLPEFLQEIYNHHNISSDAQGFATY